jgi:hypothetical protein
VLAVAVERIAARDALDKEPGGFVQTGGKMRFFIAIDPAVGFGQVTTNASAKRLVGFSISPPQLAKGRPVGLIENSCPISLSRKQMNPSAANSMG